ncbi:hypothetical protein [Nonomuraea sp. NPDC050643]|uniref:hypothetical protein n=1 Tax=Nonomuraea sp. NPDC050643 TaxID=3155660 RepID=UPI0033EFDA28
MRRVPRQAYARPSTAAGPATALLVHGIGASVLVLALPAFLTPLREPDDQPAPTPRTPMEVP